MEIDPLRLLWYKISSETLPYRKYHLSHKFSLRIPQSLWKFAQSTAVILPCSVQNFKTIGREEWMLWTNDISLDFTWRWVPEIRHSATARRFVTGQLLTAVSVSRNQCFIQDVCFFFCIMSHALDAQGQTVLEGDQFCSLLPAFTLMVPHDRVGHFEKCLNCKIYTMPSVDLDVLIHWGRVTHI